MHSPQTRSMLLVYWLEVAGIFTNLACGAYYVLRADVPVWAPHGVAVAAHVIGVVWTLLMIHLMPRFVRYLGVGERARAHLAAADIGMFGVFLLGAFSSAIRPEAFSGVPLGFLYLYPRAAWTLISLTFFTLGMVELGREVNQLRYERDKLEVVLEFSESVSLMGKDDVLRATVNEVRKLTDADSCLLFLHDPEADVLRVAAHYHNEAVYDATYVDNMVNFPCPRGFGLTGKVMETGEPMLLKDVGRASDAKLPPGESQNPKTVLLLPMKVHGNLIGVLRVIKWGVDQLSDAQVTVSSILANHAAVALDAGNLYHAVLKASRTDLLTGLGNSREFRITLDQAVAERAPFALLMVDADCLKQVNDRFGHQAGDELLIGLGDHLRRQTEGVGRSFRYAGDEFLVLLPGCDRAEAQAIAERIRHGLACTCQDPEQASVHTTVSIGVAGFPSDGTDAESVMRAADRAMYMAKQSGKNRVRLAS